MEYGNFSLENIRRILFETVSAGHTLDGPTWHIYGGKIAYLCHLFNLIEGCKQNKSQLIFRDESCAHVNRQLEKTWLVAVTTNVTERAWDWVVIIVIVTLFSLDKTAAGAENVECLCVLFFRNAFH